MGKFLADYRTRLDQILKEKAGDLDQPDKDAAIQNAAIEHSKRKPDKKVKDIFGNNAFDLDLPDGWEKDFSAILSVEFPADEREPVYLEDEDWRVYEDTAGQVLRLLFDTPSALQTVRVTFSAHHVVSDSEGTIPDGDFEAVCHYAAHFALLALSNSYVQNTDPTIHADGVDHKSMSDQAKSNAGAEKKIYFEHMGVKEGEVGAGMAFKDYDVNYPWGGDRITHPRRQR
jgi:hypothetical protein